MKDIPAGNLWKEISFISYDKLTIMELEHTSWVELACKTSLWRSVLVPVLRWKNSNFVIRYGLLPGRLSTLENLGGVWS